MVDEVGAEHSDLIGYAVRGNSENAGATVCYVTEGVLMQMLSEDFMLKSVSVVILDEVHERSQTVDILLGVLATLCRHRRREFNKELQTLI